MRSDQVSPDSHRTVSDAHRYRRNEQMERSLSKQPRQDARMESRMEWHPVRSVEGISGDQGRPTSERETEEERRRKIMGKAVVTEKMVPEKPPALKYGAGGTLKITEPCPSVHVNQVCSEPSRSTITPSGDQQRQQQGKELDRPSIVREMNPRKPELESQKTRPYEPTATEAEEDDIELLSEEEINKIAEQYASVDFEMDEEMMEEDDLLDENMEDETQVLDTQVMVEQNNTDLRPTETLRCNEGERDKNGKQGSEEAQDLVKPQNKRNRKEAKEKLQLPTNGKRRGATSPDAKGNEASKKLALRGRASPKGKLVRHSRINSLRAQGSLVIPRTEVYPSVVKGRKSSAVSGSVGSQKPPRKII